MNLPNFNLISSLKDFEELPMNSGADSFFEIRWIFPSDKERGFQLLPLDCLNGDLLFLTGVLSKLVSSFIDDTKEEWLISKPCFSIKAIGTEVTVKIAMRKKEFHKKVYDIEKES